VVVVSEKIDEKQEKAHVHDVNFGNRLCMMSEVSHNGPIQNTEDKRVLIVDDDAFSRKMMRNAAESAGFHVVGELDDGARAVQCFDAFKPDLILMDIMMNDMDGVSAAKRIFNKSREVRIIMVSAINKPEILNACMQAGVSDYIRKPFDVDMLVTSMKLALTPKAKNTMTLNACASFAADAQIAIGPRILIVDDDDFMRKKLCRTIEQNLNARIYEASDGLQAVNTVDWLYPQLVLLDIIMKNMDGVHAAKRRKEISPETSIVMVSSMRAPRMIQSCMQIGVCGYIVKPFEQQDVLATVRRVLEKRSN
jgi:two-component system, chemotaxis family, chemotaxis protein CheY